MDPSPLLPGAPLGRHIFSRGRAVFGRSRAGSWPLVTNSGSETAPAPPSQQTSSWCESREMKRQLNTWTWDQPPEELLESSVYRQWCMRSLHGWVQGKVGQMLLHVITDLISGTSSLGGSSTKDSLENPPGSSTASRSCSLGHALVLHPLPAHHR